MARKQFVPVTTAALIARINRKLKHDDEKLCKSRSEGAAHDLGEYFVIDASRNYVVTKGIELEEFGRELGVLRGWEALQS